MNKPDLPRDIARSASHYFGTPQFEGYLTYCGGDHTAALDLYQWNVEASGALWETIGHLEVAMRNRVADRLAVRHHRLPRTGSWLDDPLQELDGRARQEIAVARRRIQSKGKQVSDGQVIAELGFGFWRFLLARRYTSTLWPGIAGGFPHANSRRRETVEAPVVRLHEFRNRLAHHERVWNQPLQALYEDAIEVIRFMDADLATWVGQQSRLPDLLAKCPAPRPHR